MRFFLLATMLLPLALVSTASAVRPAKPGERAAIKRAIRNSPLTRAVPDSAYRIRRVRVSTINRRYSAARVVGTESWVQDANALMRKRNGRWRLLDLSNGGGCRAPVEVARDLDLPCY
jgi:hypothetical protein